jgi:heme/copper-type cytochrome/quinol oxidase subunit 3
MNAEDLSYEDLKKQLWQQIRVALRDTLSLIAAACLIGTAVMAMKAGDQTRAVAFLALGLTVLK